MPPPDRPLTDLTGYTCTICGAVVEDHEGMWRCDCTTVRQAEYWHWGGRVPEHWEPGEEE